MGRNLVNRYGEIYGILKIVKELGSNKVLAQCKYCNAIEEYNKSNLVNGAVKKCAACKRLNIAIKNGTEINGLRVIGYDKIRAKVECIECKDTKVVEVQSFLMGNEQCNKCNHDKKDTNQSTKQNKKIIDRVGQSFGRFTIVKELGKDRVKAQCNRCKAIGEYRKSYIIADKCKCICCDNSDSQYNIDITNGVLNGLKIIKEFEDEQGCKFCDVECITCGKSKTVPKGKLITSEVYCEDCYNRVLNVACLACGSQMQFIRKDRDNLDIKAKCSGCRISFDIPLLCSVYDARAIIREMREKYLGKPDIEGKLQFYGDIIFLDRYPRYIGRDGEAYYDVVCLKHFKKLLLTKNEIYNYNHGLCECGFDFK